MKSSKTGYKKLIIPIIVIVLIIVGFVLINKNRNNKIDANNANKNVIKTGETTSKGNPTTATTGTNGTTGTTAADGSVTEKTSTGEKVTTVDEKAAEQTKIESTKEGIAVFVKAANFGSITDISINSSKFDKSCKYYQFSLGNSVISDVEAITKTQTNIYPAQEAGNEVIISLLDVNKKIVKKFKVILNAK